MSGEIQAEALRLMVDAAHSSLADDNVEVGRASTERAIVAALTAIRTPTIGIIISGADVPDSVGHFWPIMIDGIIGC